MKKYLYAFVGVCMSLALPVGWPPNLNPRKAARIT